MVNAPLALPPFTGAGAAGNSGTGGVWDDPVGAALVATHALRGLAGLAAVPAGANALLGWRGLLTDVIRCACGRVWAGECVRMCVWA